MENGHGTMVGPYCCWKQVEVNTIASGFGWLGPASASIHRSASLYSWFQDPFYKGLRDCTAL
jgi:glutathione synthase